MQHVLTAVAGEGVRRATLEVRRSNVAALAPVRGLGFEVAGVRKRYYTQPGGRCADLWRETVANDSDSRIQRIRRTSLKACSSCVTVPI